MSWVRDYLLRLIMAAMLCGILTGFLGKKGALGATIKLMAGIFMLLTTVGPLVNMELGNIGSYLGSFSVNADDIVEAGEDAAKETISDIIKTKTEAYIVDKAASFGGELSVEVSVDSSELPVPCHVCVRGNISPYGRAQLEKIIANELGIATEEQEWIG